MKTRYEIPVTPELLSALRQIQEMGMMEKYRGSYEIVDRGDGKIILTIDEDPELMGLMDLLGAFDAGRNQKK